MQIYRNSRVGRNYIQEKVEKVPQAELNDSIFLKEDEIEDATFVERLQKCLANKGLTAVIHRARQCKNGNFRTFIGSLDYKPFETVFE